jgi:RNA polymerase sigma factor (sigma-70 family)
MEQGRIDAEDLPRIFEGRLITKAILDNIEILTELQQQIVQLYYREEHLQREIGAKLGITQQAVNDHLRRIRDKIGKHLKLPPRCPAVTVSVISRAT